MSVGEMGEQRFLGQNIETIIHKTTAINSCAQNKEKLIILYAKIYTVLASFVPAATIVGATPLLRLLIERGSYSREALIK